MSSPSSADEAPLAHPRSLAIHLDLVGGLAGDMFVAAMVDALPALEAIVLDAVARVRPDGAAAPAFNVATSGGLRARRFGIVAGDAPPAALHAHSGHGAHGDGSNVDAPTPTNVAHGTSYATLSARITDAALDTGTRKHALALLEWLGRAEANAHGVAMDDVHFHELADWDSLLDVVAAGAIAAALDGARWSASALPFGGGTIRTAHGLLPVPGPATAWLMQGYAWRDDGVHGERVTPTGAAILRHLVRPSRCANERDAGRLMRVGHGAGTRALPGMPNIARALVLEAAAPPAVDAVSVLEFDVDDMTGEEIALAAERLRAVPGVLDVSTGMRVGKKGRPAVDFRLLAQPHAADDVALACFVETSTLGLRVRDERRRVLPREEFAARSNAGALAVKVAQRPGGERTAKAAHDDVAHARGLAERRRTRAAGEQRALEDDA